MRSLRIAQRRANWVDICGVLAANVRKSAVFCACLLGVATPLLFSIDSTARADDEESFGAGAAAADTSGADEDGGLAGVASSSGAGGLTIEGLLYRRSGLDATPFTMRGDAPGATATFTRVTGDDLEGRDWSPGVRMSLQASVLDQPIELSAFFVAPFGLDYLNRNVRAGGNTDMVYANPTGSNLFADNPASAASDNILGLNIHHESKVFGGEANLASLFGIPGLSIGARAIYFGETLNTTSLDNADAINIPPPAAGSGEDRDRVAIRVDNRLIGVQLGLQHMFDVGGGLRLGGSVKGGLYNNFVDRNRTFASEADIRFGSRESSDHKSVFAQGVELNPRVEFKLSEGTYLTAAGQFMWLNNVSTALPNYGSLANIYSDHDVRARDDVYFYGGSLGLTIDLDETSPISNSLPNFPDPYDSTTSSLGGDIDAIDERVAELEDTSARKGNSKVTLNISGWINRMVLYWNDGNKSDAYVVDNVASRSRVNIDGAAKIARGWSAGYFLSFGLDDAASNDVNQLTDEGDGQLDVRYSAWWLRNSILGTATVGLTSTATDNIILKDTGGIMPGAQNIATIGGSFLVRRAAWYEQGDGALVTNAAGTVATDLNDISGGASVDTLRRNAIRYDAPRLQGQWGNVDLAVAWGSDDFFDAAIEHSINYNDFRFRFGAGYLHDTREGRPGGRRDRREYKGSASLLHIPTGLFGTAAYVQRTFHGWETFGVAGTPQATFGENTAGRVTPPGTNRPPIDYLYTAFGLRRQYWSLGDTSIYGEYAQVNDAITGLLEAGLSEVTDSTLEMYGAAISQDVDSAGMDIYAGVRVYDFDTRGVRARGAGGDLTPVPLTDIMFGYAGTRIKF